MSEKDLWVLAEEVSYLDEPVVREYILRPQWEHSHPKWQSFVPCAFRDAWESLGLEIRLVLFIMASMAEDDADAGRLD